MSSKISYSCDTAVTLLEHWQSHPADEAFLRPIADMYQTCLNDIVEERLPTFEKGTLHLIRGIFEKRMKEAELDEDNADEVSHLYMAIQDIEAASSANDTIFSSSSSC